MKIGSIVSCRFLPQQLFPLPDPLYQRDLPRANIGTASTFDTVQCGEFFHTFPSFGLHRQIKIQRLELHGTHLNAKATVDAQVFQRGSCCFRLLSQTENSIGPLHHRNLQRTLCHSHHGSSQNHLSGAVFQASCSFDQLRHRCSDGHDHILWVVDPFAGHRKDPPHQRNLFIHCLADSRSCVLHPASTTHRQLSSADLEAIGIKDNLVRLSVGIENADDLIADLAQALESV